MWAQFKADSYTSLEGIFWQGIYRAMPNRLGLCCTDLGATRNARLLTTHMRPLVHMTETLIHNSKVGTM